MKRILLFQLIFSGTTMINCLSMPSESYGKPLFDAVRANQFSEMQKIVSENSQIVTIRDIGGRTALHEAADVGNLNSVTLLVVAGSDINAQDRYGQTPLHRAVAQKWNIDVVIFLIENGADITARDTDGTTPLLHAVRGSCIAHMRSLVKKGADIHESADNGRTLLHEAAVRGDSDVVRFLIAKGMDVTCRDKSGKTPLREAVGRVFLDVMTSMVIAGARHERGWTPLHVAAKLGCRDVARVLIDNGFDVKARDVSYERLPLHIAARFGSLGVFRVLFKHFDPFRIAADYDDLQRALCVAAGYGHLALVRYLSRRVNLYRRFSDNITPLHCAAGNGHLDIVEFLFKNSFRRGQASFNYDRRTAKRQTALHLAIEKGHQDVAEFLIKKGFCVNMRGYKDNTPLHCAVKSKNSRLVKFLLTLPVWLERKNQRGRTPLHVAAWLGEIASVQCLVQKGSDIEAVDNEGYTPLQICLLFCKQKKKEICQCLLERYASVREENEECLNGLLPRILSERGSVLEEILLQEKCPRDVCGLIFAFVTDK